MITIINITLLVLIAFCYAIVSLAYAGKLGDDRKPYGFWGAMSYMRKYRLVGFMSTVYPPTKGLYGWYHKFFKIKYKERFPLSATALVSFTDGLHTVQWFMLKFLYLLIAVNFDYPMFQFLNNWGLSNLIWDFFVSWIIFGTIFTLTYKYFNR